MSNLVEGGYTDTQWVMDVARPRVRATLLALAHRRSTGKLNGRMSPVTLARIEAVLGRGSALARWSAP